MHKITAAQTILNVDLKHVLQRVEERYGTRLPKGVITVAFSKRSGLYIRFKHTEAIGEPSEDERTIFLHSPANGLVAVELLDAKEFA